MPILSLALDRLWTSTIYNRYVFIRQNERYIFLDTILGSDLLSCSPSFALFFSYIHAYFVKIYGKNGPTIDIIMCTLVLSLFISLIREFTV